MKHRRAIVITVVLVAIVIIFSRLTADKPVEVAVKAVDRGAVESSVANTRAGTVKACRRAHLAPTIGGQVAELRVTEGDQVIQDQLLLELWNKDLQAQLQLSQEELNAAKSAAKEVCILSEMAQREAQRLNDLRNKKLVSEDELDRATTNAKAKQASCTTTQTQTQVVAAKIAVAQAALERTRVRAPFAGTIAEVNAEVGEFVTPSPPGILTLPAIDIIDTQCLYVEAPIDEVDAPAITPGMSARVTLDAFRSRQFDAQVKRIAPYVLEREKQARTVTVDVSFGDNNDLSHLLPGFSADIEIILHASSNTLRIPTEAIIESNHVYVFLTDDERLEKREIKTGLSNWKFTEVLSGLEEGEWVVTSVERKGVSEGAYAVAETPHP